MRSYLELGRPCLGRLRLGFVRAANRGFGRGHYRQKLRELPLFANLVGIRFGKLRPKEHWCFVPGLEHGSGTGDHWHGGKDRRSDGPWTPLERFLNPSSPGEPDPNFLLRRTGMTAGKKLWRNRKESRYEEEAPEQSC